MEELLIAAPVLVALGACIAGVSRANAFQPDRKAVLGGLVVSLAAAALAFTWRDSEVEGSTVFIGILLGGLAFGALPVWIYFSLGRALADHRVVLAVLFVASIAPLYFYCVVMLLFVVDVVGCPPGAYECPV